MNGLTATDVFTAFFQELERRGIPYVILHSYQDFPATFKSDVDYAVADDRRHEIPTVEREVARRCGWRVVQRMEHETCAFSSILINPDSPAEYLMLDVTSHYIRNRCFFLRDLDLLHARRRFKGFFIPCPSSEFIYTWVKVFAKFKDHEPYIARLRELFQQEPERSQELFTRVFGAQAGRAEDWFDKCAAEWKALGRMLHRRNRYTLAQCAQEWRRIVHRIFHPTGLSAAFLGPDGAGKSTAIAHVSRLLQPCFRRTRMIHFTPRLKRGDDNAPVTNPQGRPPRGTLLSWGKIVYYFACHWIHRLLRQIPARISTTLIIFDRTFDDLLVDPRRYRVQHSGALVRFLGRFLPRPDLTIILDAPAEVVQTRKVELPLEEIERQRTALRELAAHSPQAVVVSAAAPVDDVSREVCRHILNRLAQRQDSRT